MRPFLFILIVAVPLVACNSPSAAGQSGSYDYYEAKKLFWGTLYARGGKTIYCGETFNARKGKRINVEHIMPMSWAIKKLNCKDRKSCRKTSQRFRQIEADIHNFYPSRRDINQARGSFPFGIIKGERRFYGQCDFEFDRKRRVVEPRVQVRGDIARAMFYMYDRYAIRIHSRQAQMLKQWNRQDPPDSFELKRNNVIEKLQGNRNRFIDKPADVDNLRF